MNRFALVKERWETVAIFLLGMCSVSYFYSTFMISSKSPLWMDEVMAAWMSQLYSLRMISRALLHGTMSSPPTYFYILHLVRTLFGGSNLALRMPSIVAVYVAAIAVYLLMRRTFSVPHAGLAMVLCLEAGLFSYATQVREYALVTACFALAALVWYTPAEKAVPLWRVVLIAILLAGCVALHFYGVLLVAAFALMELLWSTAQRRIRLNVWTAIIIAGASVLAWLPLAHQIMNFTGSYTAASHYFAKPTISRLLTAYGNLALGGKALSLFCSFLLLSSFLLYWEHGRYSRLAVESRQPTPDVNLDIVIVATTVIPLIVFIFALVVTKTFNERYAIAASLGFAMLFARFISNMQMGSAISCALILGSVFLLGAAPRHIPPADRYGMRLMENTGDSAPIVVGEGLAFFELEAAADSQLQKRLVYLTTPSGEVSPDPTNEDLVKRWHEFRPELNVVDADHFVQSNNHFYLLHSNLSTDVITPWLMLTGRLRAKWNKAQSEYDNRDVWFFEVKGE